MVERTTGISNEFLIHPGETISDIIIDRGMTQKELAVRTGVSEPFLSDVINGKKSISKGLAIGLEYAFGIPSSFWLNLQANYDAEVIALEEEKSVTDSEVEAFGHLKKIVTYLRKSKAIPAEEKDLHTILNMRRFLGTSNLSNLNKVAMNGTFRLSSSASVDPYVLGAWLCLCRRPDSECKLEGVFKPECASELISEIKKIMCSSSDNPEPVLKALFAKNGIDFSVVQNFPGAPVQGYLERREDGSFKMRLTIRGSFADIFWFSLFHELGHIVNGDLPKAGVLIDSKDNGKEREDRADCFAADTLIDSYDYHMFVRSGHFSYAEICRFSEKQIVPPYIVIGRLQKDGFIPYSMFSAKKPKYKWYR